MSQHRFYIDDMDTTGENVLRCECGKRLWPDCDMSRISIIACFEQHQRENQE